MGDEFEAAVQLALAELDESISKLDLAAPMWVLAWIARRYPAVALEAARAAREEYHSA